MWKLTNVVFVVWISVLAISDWKTRQIQKGFTYGGIIAIFMLRLLFEEAYLQNLEWILSMLPGAVFCLMSFITKGKLGLGDGICILGIGIALNLQQTILSVLTACFIAGIYAMGLLVRRKNHTKMQTKIPFIPFLLCGTVISFL